MKKVFLVLALLLSLQTWAQQNIEVINIENPAVQAYMSDSTYFYNSNYTTTINKKYYDSGRYGSNLDWPQGKYVEWTPTTSSSNISEVCVYLSENNDFSDADTFYPGNNASSYTIRNMMPNRIYYYSVVETLGNGTRNQVASGVFRTVGQVRMIQVINSHNVRDLGGWMTSYGMRIKYGLLYRSANLDRISTEGRQAFANNLNVGAELDLRASSKLTESKLGADKALRVAGHSSGSQGVAVDNHVYPADLAFLVETLREGKAVDWHCAIGCDRCGAVSFLIGGLLGMSEIDLCRDFELSTFAGHDRPRGHVSSMLKHVKKFGPADDLATCFYNYWLSIGANEDDMNFLISYCLEPYEQEGYEY